MKIVADGTADWGICFEPEIGEKIEVLYPSENNTEAEWEDTNNVFAVIQEPEKYNKKKDCYKKDETCHVTTLMVIETIELNKYDFDPCEDCYFKTPWPVRKRLCDHILCQSESRHDGKCVHFEDYEDLTAED